MLDSVRVAGRWISKPLLERLTARSRGPVVPTRRAMLKEFCRLAHRVDRKGRLCLSSANVAIGRLEKSGWANPSHEAPNFGWASMVEKPSSFIKECNNPESRT